MLIFKILLISGLYLLPASAYAAEQLSSKVKISGSVRFQATRNDNSDLGTSSENFSDSENIEGKIRIKEKLTDHLTFFNKDRFVINYGDGSEDPETNKPLGQKDFLEIRQLWLQYNGLAGVKPLGMKIGRQRFSEPYGLWWNRDLDALRFSYDAALFTGFIAAGENLGSYRTTDEDFLEKDENIFRVMAEVTRQWKTDHYIEGRFAWQNDHSNMEDPGTIVPSLDRDAEDAELAWAGVRARGNNLPLLAGNSISYRVDILSVAGKANEQLTTAGPANNRTKTGSNRTDVLGWAFDAGLNVPLPLKPDALLLFDYAYGSGDDNAGNGTDHSFRQTGLDSNTSTYSDALSTINHYGFTLRPDLSNIHIWTPGFKTPGFKARHFTTLYHHYRLADKAAELRNSDVDAPLNGSDKDLGHAVGMMLSVNLTGEAELPETFINEID
ncbi:MAG: alginate export family protein [Alphaproteobacteria bacterium]